MLIRAVRIDICSFFSACLRSIHLCLFVSSFDYLLNFLYWFLRAFSIFWSWYYEPRRKPLSIIGYPPLSFHLLVLGRSLNLVEFRNASRYRKQSFWLALLRNFFATVRVLQNVFPVTKQLQNLWWNSPFSPLVRKIWNPSIFVIPIPNASYSHNNFIGLQFLTYVCGTSSHSLDLRFYRALGCSVILVYV